LNCSNKSVTEPGGNQQMSFLAPFFPSTPMAAQATGLSTNCHSAGKL
jgi:hypothetical protein